MAKLPQIPRRSRVTGAQAMISDDWDRSFLQPLVRAVDTLTPGGTFANNVAALAGGLLVGQVYQTATGELRIVV